MLGFKLLRVITESIQDQKHRVEARYLSIDCITLYTVEASTKERSQLFRKPETRKISPSDHLSSFCSQASSREFLWTCVLGGIFLIESSQVWCPQEPLQKQLKHRLSLHSLLLHGNIWLALWLPPQWAEPGSSSALKRLKSVVNETWLLKARERAVALSSGSNSGSFT